MPDITLLTSVYLTEQVGQEILSNLHSDREKIQRARERVSVHMPPAHTLTSALTNVCETVKMLELVSSIDSFPPHTHTRSLGYAYLAIKEELY